MQSHGVEPIYWADTKSGLMDIYNFSGVIYATDGSKGSTGMGAGFYRHDTKGGGCCRVEGGAGSSGRADLQRHVRLLKTPSPTTSPLWFSQTPKDS